jgi:hypothetical protein
MCRILGHFKQRARAERNRPQCCGELRNHRIALRTSGRARPVLFSCERVVDQDWVYAARYDSRVQEFVGIGLSIEWSRLVYPVQSTRSALVVLVLAVLWISKCCPRFLKNCAHHDENLQPQALDKTAPPTLMQ